MNVIHPSGLVAFEKPPGLRSHPNGKRADSRALLTCRYSLREEFFFWNDGAGKGQRLFLLNRLDAPVSGLILGAFSQEVARAGKEQFAARKVFKRYYALVKGRAPEGKQRWRDTLQVTREGGQIRARCDKRRGVIALALVSFVKEVGLEGEVCSLIALEPKTGRPHQLRAQCAERGLPIVGDALYGDFRFNRVARRATKFPWLFLHSAEVCLVIDKQSTFHARSELPRWFVDLE